MEHAALAPSNMKRIVACPGSVALCQRYPEPQDRPEAADGTAAHWAWQQLLAGQLIDVGVIAPNGVPLTDEMIEAAELYADSVRETAQFIEHRVHMANLHADNWGTPDTFGAQESDDWLIVGIDDFKYGHRFVDVYQNWQLINYAKGVLNELGIDGLREQRTKIVFRIVQPRCYHHDGPVRTWTIVAADLRAYWNQIAAACTRAMQPDAPCIPNSECRDCSARAHCEPFQREITACLDEAGRPTPLELPPAALGLELRMVNHAIERLTARQTGLEAVALATIKQGVNVPGFGVETGNGRERWARPIPEVIALGQMMQIDIAKPDAMTPKQAVKAGLPAELVAAYTETPKGETKLVPDDGTLARKIFNHEVQK